MPFFSKYFEVFHFEDAEEAVLAIEDVNSRHFLICVAKLGSTGNLGKSVFKALNRKSEKNDLGTILMVHSATAMDSKKIRDALSLIGVQLFVDQRSEKILFAQLEKIATDWYLKHPQTQ